MNKEYEAFVRELRQTLLEKLGLKEDQIFFKERDEDELTSDGDRLFVECNSSSSGREICGIHVEELHESYEDGTSFERIVNRVEKEIRKVKETGFFNKTQNLDNYEKIKEDLFIRLINRKKYKRELSRAVYKVVGDVALVLYMKIGEQDGYTSSMKIRRECLERWQQDRDAVFEAALINTYFMASPRIYFWEKLMYNPEYDGECFMDLNRDFPLKRDKFGNCLSTVRRTNGAVAIFLPGVAARLARLLNTDFYMVFTSIHEVMIHNANVVYPDDLEEILGDTLREATPEEDVLTERIYRYCRDTGEFIMYKGEMPGEKERIHWPEEG